MKSNIQKLPCNGNLSIVQKRCQEYDTGATKMKCPRRKKWFAKNPTYCTANACPESKKCPYPKDYGIKIEETA